jgi:hypothetical protein
MPERLPPTQQLANLKKLQAEFEAAYTAGQKTGDPTRAEELKTQIETGAAALRDSLDPSAHAEKILGRDAITLKEIADIADDDGAKVFETKGTRRLQFSREDLERAAQTGEQLYYVPSTFTPAIVAKHGFPDASITMERLHKVFPKTHDGKKLLFNIDWYKKEDFFTKDTLREGWRLTSKDVIPDSTSKTYLQQFDVLVKHLEEVVYKDRAMPQEYSEAIKEYRDQRADIAGLMTTNQKAAAEALVALKLAPLSAESPAEVLLRLVINDRVRNDPAKKDVRPLKERYARLPRLTSDGSPVRVGYFDDVGANVSRGDPRVTHDVLGVCLSHS